MSLRLVIEHSPWRQPVTEFTHPGGELSIGRGTEADWRLEDPDQYISRKHCVIAGGEEGYVVTDTSRGGVFLDGSDQPLGPGRSRALADGTRIRLGDVVIRAEVTAAAAASPQAAAVPLGAFSADDFFAQKPVAIPPAPRPVGLPEPFDAPRARRPQPFEAPVRREAPPAFDDPFTLDPLPSRPVEGSAVEPPRESRAAVRGAVPPRDPFAPTDPAPLADDPFAPPADPFGRAPPPREGGPPPLPGRAQAVGPPNEPARPRDPMPRPAAPGDADLVRALLRGLGLPEDSAPTLGATEIEALGRRHRALIEGLSLSLRSRAREKQNLRVAQTVLGSADVNPLKVLPTTDEVVAALVGPPRPGYLDGDAAIAGAQRDLADHQVRSWTGVQAALRRMIDRFDPEAIEREAEEAGRLRAILAGGRAAFLWRLYRERFRAIAKAAEDRFLGEVGSDFRDAYESKGRQSHD